MPPINMLIKPASGSCNLSCRYCFYADEARSRETYSFGMMSIETLENVVKKALEYAQQQATFGFQGGEPTLAGLPFFREVVRLQKAHNAKRLRIENAIQTNGTLLDEDWARFFHEARFLVGLSLDGTQRLNDRHRTGPGGKGTFFDIMRAVALLKKHRVDFNILTVVTAQIARDPERIYRFYQKNGLDYQQYIPCLDPLGAPRGQHDYSLTPEGYARFFIALFDLWYDDVSRGRFVYIRHFENMFNVVCGYPPEHCGMMGHCAMQHVIEADGGVYPCDFYALDAYRLGNLNEDGLDDIARRLAESGFIEASLKQEPECRACRWFAVCRGGCRRDRDMGGALGLNYYCAAFQAFYAHAIPKMVKLRDRRGLNRR